MSDDAAPSEVRCWIAIAPSYQPALLGALARVQHFTHTPSELIDRVGFG